MRIGIIGAGMAGLACAEGLAGQGHEVILLDKGRGPGGRMSTRRMATPAGEAQFDHGAQFFTVRDPGFVHRVEAWIAQGVAAPWPAAGPEAFVGVPGMNAPIRQMAQGQAVSWSHQVSRIEALGSGYRLHLEGSGPVEVEALVVATPAEQAAVLLDTLAPDLAARAAATVADPCWTTMLAFAEPVAVAQDCWRSEGEIGWAARNSSKPGRDAAEAWVVQASPAWSRAHLEDKAGDVAALQRMRSDINKADRARLGATVLHYAEVRVGQGLWASVGGNAGCLFGRPTLQWMYGPDPDMVSPLPWTCRCHFGQCSIHRSSTTA
jgi:predicted NAD/FAD-dependent oxidoreductase